MPFPIAFTLVVDDFGVKYANKKNADHLVTTLKVKYKISEDWTGSLYCGIDIRWNYTNRTLDLGTPEYIKTQLQLYKHKNYPPPALPTACSAEAIRQECTASNTTR